jgi:gluconolactonase
MQSYAQTNLQLFNQLRRDGFTNADLELVRDAYQLAMVVLSGRFQPSGKSFIAHVVGTASILASLRLPGTAVAAGLLHNVYESGDFGDGRKGISAARRRKVRRAVGPEVEKYVGEFPRLYWEPRTTQLARQAPDKLDSTERTVLLILFADHLEHLLDRDVLYYDDTVARFYIDHSRIAAEIADKLGLSKLAAELKEAIRATEAAELPVDLAVHEIRSEAFVITPESYRKRLSVTLHQKLIQTIHRSRSKIRRGLSLLYRKSTGFVKALSRVQERYTIRWKPKSKPVSECLQTNSEAFRKLFTDDAVLERVATGFQFTEGPVWIKEGKGLLFSDISANRILKLTPDGRVTTFRKPSGNSNGLTRDQEGRLIACEHSNRRVTRTERDGSITVLADKFQRKSLNSPNDVIVKSDGAIYFTDPPYGIKLHEQEQPVQGVYRLSADGSELSLVVDDFIGPNGLAFSPDEKKLYIDDSQQCHVRVFNVENNGLLSGGAVFHDMNVSTPGAPDGMKVDVAGHVYCTGPGGVWVFDNAGKHLGTIITSEQPSNCAWGDEDWRSLYITAGTSVYKIRVNTPGIRIP